MDQFSERRVPRIGLSRVIEGGGGLGLQRELGVCDDASAIERL